MYELIGHLIGLLGCYLQIIQLYFLLKSMFVDNIYEHDTNNTFDTFSKLE